MSRWQPNPRGRLEQAALELYKPSAASTRPRSLRSPSGRALTEADVSSGTFTDKREVLFRGQGALMELVTRHIAEAGGKGPPRADHRQPRNGTPVSSGFIAASPARALPSAGDRDCTDHEWATGQGSGRSVPGVDLGRAIRAAAAEGNPDQGRWPRDGGGA